MGDPAYLSDELKLDEATRAGVRDLVQSAPTPTVHELLAVLRRHGHRVEGVIETAYALPLEQFRTVEAAWKRLPEQDRPKIRRRR